MHIYTNEKFLDMIHDLIRNIFEPALKAPSEVTGEPFGTPRVLFIALDEKSQRFIVGASSLNFPRKFRKEIYKVHSEKRKQALEDISENRKLRRTLRRLTALAKSEGNGCMPKLFPGHLGEAVSIPGFATKMPCVLVESAKIYYYYDYSAWPRVVRSIYLHAFLHGVWLRVCS
jgi:hypothetical protein